jgi:hypothetical protein
VEQLEIDQGSFTFPITFRWLFMIVVVAGITAIATGILASSLSTDSVIDVFGWFSPFLLALNRLLAVLITLLVYILSPLILLFSWFFSQIFGAINPDLQEAFENLELLPEEGVTDNVSGELLLAPETTVQLPTQLISILIMLAIVLLVSLALGRMVRRLRRTTGDQVQSRGLLIDATQYGSSGIRQRVFNRFALFRRWRTAASIRQLYRQMSIMAGDHGYPRSQSETPYEYLQTLYQAWPEDTDKVNRITEAYVRAHYGELPDDPSELGELAEAWKTLESRSIARQGGEAEDLTMHRR